MRAGGAVSMFGMAIGGGDCGHTRLAALLLADDDTAATITNKVMIDHDRTIVQING